MNSSFLYHAWGLYSLECTREEYKGNTIILHVQNKKRLSVCPKCGKLHLVKNGYRIRDFLGLPIGGKKIVIRMKVQRYKCNDCDYDQQEKIRFATGSSSYTHRFAKYVVDLLRSMTLKDVAARLEVSWDTVNPNRSLEIFHAKKSDYSRLFHRYSICILTQYASFILFQDKMKAKFSNDRFGVKEIHSHYLESHYSPPSLDGVKCIGIDEFAVKKGHIYKTIVVDLISGRILYVGEGKGIEALADFWKKVRRKNVSIKYVATDLSAAFIGSVLENCPDAIHVFDHFHVVKLMNDKLDDIRRIQYNMEKDINKRKVLKGTRYLLLCNGADIYDAKYKTRLENALAMNEPLSKAYYLKEQLREIWLQVRKEEAEKVLTEWVEQAKESHIPQLQKMAMTILAYKRGILAWYDCHISTGKVEGINNKIKMMKRNAYGFREERYFKLRLYALHDCRITRKVG